MSTKKMKIDENTSVGIAISSGGAEVFYQALGFAEYWYRIGLPVPKRVVGTSGGTFGALVFAMPYLLEDVSSMILDDDFQGSSIYEKNPWRYVAMYGTQRYVLRDTIKKYLGDPLELLGGVCGPDSKSELIVVTTPMSRSAGNVRGTNRRPYEAHFSSRDNDAATMAEAILASSAIPLLTEPSVIEGYPHTDGAVSRYYPLGVACKGVDIAIGFCFQMGTQTFSDSASVKILQGVERWGKPFKVIRRIREEFAAANERGKMNLPVSTLDTILRIIDIHIWQGIEAEETWARRQEAAVEMLGRIEEDMAARGLLLVSDENKDEYARMVADVLRKNIERYTPYLQDIAPHISIFTEPSGANLDLGFRTHREWTRAQKLEAMRYGRERAEEELRNHGIV